MDGLHFRGIVSGDDDARRHGAIRQKTGWGDNEGTKGVRGGSPSRPRTGGKFRVQPSRKLAYAQRTTGSPAFGWRQEQQRGSGGTGPKRSNSGNLQGQNYEPAECAFGK